MPARPSGMDAEQMQQVLADLPKGSVIFVSYNAGLPSKPVATLEASQHPGPRRYFTGEFQSMWKTKRGEVVFTVLAYNRDHLTTDGCLEPGGYRTINPALGELIHLEIIRKAESQL